MKEETFVDKYKRKHPNSYIIEEFMKRCKYVESYNSNEETVKELIDSYVLDNDKKLELESLKDTNPILYVDETLNTLIEGFKKEEEIKELNDKSINRLSIKEKILDINGTVKTKKGQTCVIGNIYIDCREGHLSDYAIWIDNCPVCGDIRNKDIENFNLEILTENGKYNINNIYPYMRTRIKIENRVGLHDVFQIVVEDSLKSSSSIGFEDMDIEDMDSCSFDEIEEFILILNKNVDISFENMDRKVIDNIINERIIKLEEKNKALKEKWENEEAEKEKERHKRLEDNNIPNQKHKCSICNNIFNPYDIEKDFLIDNFLEHKACKNCQVSDGAILQFVKDEKNYVLSEEQSNVFKDCLPSILSDNEKNGVPETVNDRDDVIGVMCDWGTFLIRKSFHKERGEVLVGIKLDYDDDKKNEIYCLNEKGKLYNEVKPDWIKTSVESIVSKTK